MAFGAFGGASGSNGWGVSGTAAPSDRLGTGTELALLRSRRDAGVILLEMFASLPLDALGAANAGAVSAEGALLLDLDVGLAAGSDAALVATTGCCSATSTGSWFCCGGCARHGGTLPLRDGTLRDGTAVEGADVDDAATSALAFAGLMSLCTCEILIFTLGLLGGDSTGLVGTRSAISASIGPG